MEITERGAWETLRGGCEGLNVRTCESSTLKGLTVLMFGRRNASSGRRTGSLRRRHGLFAFGQTPPGAGQGSLGIRPPLPAAQLNLPGLVRFGASPRQHLSSWRHSAPGTKPHLPTFMKGDIKRCLSTKCLAEISHARHLTRVFTRVTACMCTSLPLPPVEVSVEIACARLSLSIQQSWCGVLTVPERR